MILCEIVGTLVIVVAVCYLGAKVLNYLIKKGDEL